MSVTVNKDALKHAKQLLRDGKVVRDEHDDWSEDAPSTDKRNSFLDRHGWDAYALWFLGEDDAENRHTKARYLFPYGDFVRLHRCAVISAESRAGQYHHGAVERVLKELLDAIDADRDRD